MNLKELMDSVTEKKEYNNNEKKENKLLKDILDENRFKLLLFYLNEKCIFTTGDLKRLAENEIVALKKDIPSLAGVGEEKTQLYLKKINELLNTKYVNETENNNNLVKKYGLIGNPQKWHIEINHIKFGNNDFIDIRKVSPEGIRGKGITMKINDAMELNQILSKEFTKNDSLKNAIINNEKELLKNFNNDFGISINMFIKKIESLSKDGDIVKFLNNSCILDIKKEQYDMIHRNGMKTAIDIMNEYDKSNLEYTDINNLKIGDRLNTMTICAMVNNFNQMLGMYYNEIDNYLVLKSQTSGGEYNNKWINDSEMLYFLQNEKDKKYINLEFSHKPNQICRDIILKYNMVTKVYLFERKSKKEDYVFCGEFKPVKFTNNNRSIILEKNNYIA